MTKNESVRPLVEFRGVEKRYGSGPAAVERLDLSVPEGEFLSLLGPSGSGKTTTLMMLAGFESPSAGDILLRGQSLAGRPAHQRNMGVVFQNYALFPHMTVAENVAFPLNVRGIKGAAAAQKVEAALALVRLQGLGERRPDALSGGQRQRVALARALIFKPDVVLMDEPLSAIDRALRERLQAEIKDIQRQLNLTVLYVTHDQTEALTLSDRIAVFANGSLQQVDTPDAIYERPANAFVAGFVGANNALPGAVTKREGSLCEVLLEGGQTIRATAIGDIAPGHAVITTVRPEHIATDAAAASACNRFEGHVADLVYYGDHRRMRVLLPGGAALMLRPPDGVNPKPMETFSLGWCAERCFAFAADGTVNAAASPGTASMPIAGGRSSGLPASSEREYR